VLAVKIGHVPGCLTLSVWPDAGRLVGLGRNATWRAVYRGEIPSISIGGRRLVLLVPLLRLLGADNDAVRDAVLKALVGAVEGGQR
jgi:hypothetical protein